MQMAFKELAKNGGAPKTFATVNERCFLFIGSNGTNNHLVIAICASADQNVSEAELAGAMSALAELSRQVDVASLSVAFVTPGKFTDPARRVGKMLKVRLVDGS